ncbi:hypothetical protein EsH8_IV_001301 [Colletotrichum jinshuiense]
MTQPYIVGDSSPFLKRVLIPFWIVRVAIMLLEIIIYAFAIAVFSRNQEELNDIGGIERTAGMVIGVSAVIVAIITCCLILDIVCIVKRSRRTLSPLFFLISNVLQSLVWTVLFILAIIGGSSAFGFIIAIVVYASFFGLLIYASVIYHRFRKGTLRGNYAPANNPAAYTGGYPSDAHANQPIAYGGGYPNNEPVKPYDTSAPRYEMDSRYA